MTATNEINANKLVSIVVPFYCEEEGVPVFVSEVTAVIDAHRDIDFEVICVDDGSRDKTLQCLIAAANIDPRFVVIELSRNFGKEAALTAGIDAANGDAVIPVDADLQDPLYLIGRMIEEWRKGADVVLARRVDRSSDTYLKRRSADMFYKFHNKLSAIKIPNNVGDFRLMDRLVVNALRSLPERQRFMKGLFAWVGFRTVTIDFQRQPRAAGQSHFSGWKLWNFALEGITSFSTTPLKVWTYIGAVGAFISTCYALYIVMRTLVWGVDVPGYASLLVVTLFLGSLQLLSVGVLGEYIGRLYVESKQRPNYIVRRIYGQRNRQVKRESYIGA